MNDEATIADAVLLVIAGAMGIFVAGFVAGWLVRAAW